MCVCVVFFFFFSFFFLAGGILLLGECKFAPAGSAGAALSSAPVALPGLLGVSLEQLRAALTHNTVIVNKQQMASELTPAQALDARDTLAKATYQRLFGWVYERINAHIAADKQAIKAVIGVLDIYGFEVFKSNSFEQVRSCKRLSLICVCVYLVVPTSSPTHL